LSSKFFHDENNADMSKVLKACYEFDINASMRANRGDDEAMTKMKERMSEAIQPVVGNHKMESIITSHAQENEQFLYT